MKEKLIILDNTDLQVYVKSYIDKDWGDILEFLNEHGFNPEYCTWMLVDKVVLNID
jgi:hypothetical protein